MRIRIWTLVLSLTLLAAMPVDAKRSTSANKSSETQSASDEKHSETSDKGSETGGNLDELLDGKVPPPKPLPSLDSIQAPPPKAGTVLPESTDDGRAKQSADESSQVEQAKSAPQPKNLQATIEKTGLNGNADDGAEGLERQPSMAPGTVLKGNASRLGSGVSEDPDVADSELMIEWDRWRNRFLQAVQQQVQVNVNHPNDFDEPVRPRFDPQTGMVARRRFPLGTVTWFSCEITSDRRIKNLKLDKSSGIESYDRAVMDGVRNLEGTGILVFPRGSHRMVVSQIAGIKTAASPDYQYHHFGDVEHYRERQ